VKKTVLNNLASDQTGAVLVRFLKQEWDDEVLVRQEYHRTIIAPDTAVSDQIAAVNLHLTAMGEAEVDTVDLAAIEAYVANLRA
jgi:hypothetical protein